jgi:hypothetical protein
VLRHSFVIRHSSFIFSDVQIHFTKRKDGNTVLRCVRDDGSSTWQRNDDQHARFFPVNDLMHYAVETELGFRRGFYGLIAEGWEIAETTGKMDRGPLPNETLEAEYFVSALSAERASDTASTAEEFNHLAANFARARALPSPRHLSEEELARIRSRFDELTEKWRRLPPGETLEVVFLLWQRPCGPLGAKD